MNVRKIMFIAGLAVFIARPECSAQDITVRKTGAEHFLLDLSGFESRAGEDAPALFRRVLKSNLVRSGWFTLVDAGRADFEIVGEVEQRGSGLRVRCEAHNAATRERLLGKRYRDSADNARRLAHTVSDEIVLALTGRPGIAGARIVMVGTRTGSKELYVCDSDGNNLRQLTDDKSVSVGPKWGPDGARVVYTSFRSRFPNVYLVDLGAGRRTCIARYPGLNACASISPCGGKVALTLSRDGNPDLFVKDIDSGRLTRLTAMKDVAHAGPSWSPDGRRIVFVSDVTGPPQLYVINSSGGSPRRITSGGSANVDPDWGPNGLIAYSSRVGANYLVHVLNPDTLETRRVGRSDADYLSPSWAPDGRHIVCEGRRDHRSRIFVIDTMTDSVVSLLPETMPGEWQSPDWSAR